MPTDCSTVNSPATVAAWVARVDELVNLYQMIARTRMEGIPMLNHALRVQAVGFEMQSPPDAVSTGKDGTAVAAGVGVLVTPLLMNLVWLPLQRQAQYRRVGCKVSRHVGTETFEFIVAQDDNFGCYEACSLFSPVFEFPDHATAVATAQAVLDALRQPVRAKTAVAPAPPATLPVVPARRAFLLGRASTKVDRV